MLTVEYLRSRLAYDSETGKITWLPKPGADKWNARFAGRQAFCRKSARGGYLLGKIDNIDLRAHRLAFALFHGAWPVGEVDHINGDVTDNRIVNLRDASPSQNCRNQKMPKNNRSGALGVWFDARRQKWRAEARHGGVNHKLGSFLTREDAEIARSAANDQFGYHANHGRV